MIQLTSAEYTGPLEFVQFWLDTIIEWEQETGNSMLVALSATKDVQDAILADPVRNKYVDIVDIRYWTCDKNMKLYAPPGGANLAPRQHMRQLKPEESSFASIVLAVRETRVAHPQKAVMYYADQNCRSGRDGWAVLIGGGSLPGVKLPDKLAAAVTTMQPTDGVVSSANAWCLAGSQDYLIYSSSTDPVELTLSPGNYEAVWLDEKTVEKISSEEVHGGEIKLRPQSHVLWLIRD